MARPRILEAGLWRRLWKHSLYCPTIASPFAVSFLRGSWLVCIILGSCNTNEFIFYYFNFWPRPWAVLETVFFLFLLGDDYSIAICREFFLKEVPGSCKTMIFILFLPFLITIMSNFFFRQFFCNISNNGKNWQKNSVIFFKMFLVPAIL